MLFATYEKFIYQSKIVHAKYLPVKLQRESVELYSDSEGGSSSSSRDTFLP